MMMAIKPSLISKGHLGKFKNEHKIPMVAIGKTLIFDFKIAEIKLEKMDRVFLSERYNLNMKWCLI